MFGKRKGSPLLIDTLLGWLSTCVAVVSGLFNRTTSEPGRLDGWVRCWIEAFGDGIGCECSFEKLAVVRTEARFWSWVELVVALSTRLFADILKGLFEEESCTRSGEGI